MISRKSRVFALVSLVAVAASFVSCGKRDDSTSGTTIPTKAPSATYTVRGEVASLPVAGDPKTQFRVHHEAIHDFKDRDGKVVGMSAMTMDFPPAKGVDLSTLKKGDIVEVVFSVWWGNTPPWLATKVTKLPDDTKLVFGKANPPKSTTP